MCSYTSQPGETRLIELIATALAYRHPSIDVSADIVCSGAVSELRRILILTSEYRLCYGYHGNPSDGHCQSTSVAATHVRADLECDEPVQLFVSYNSEKHKFTDVALTCKETMLGETQAIVDKS